MSCLLDRDFFRSPKTDYQSIQDHSDKIDFLLGVSVRRIENELSLRAQTLFKGKNSKEWGPSLHDGKQTWVGLDPRQLLTPYFELLQVCELLRPNAGSHVVDLGAAYGRMGLVMANYAPEAKFTGFEYVQSRVVEANRIFEKFNCRNANVIEADLSAHDFIMPKADFYMMYDYGQVHHIKKTLEQLEEIGNDHKIKVVARGSGCTSLIDYLHPWLSQVYKPYRTDSFAVYSNYE